jgi:hypothetical protein
MPTMAKTIISSSPTKIKPTSGSASTTASVNERERRAKQRENIETADHYRGLRHAHGMNATEALQLEERLPGGTYYVDKRKLKQPYESKFQGLPSIGGIYNTSTPKMWPPETQYTMSQSRSEVYDSDLTKKVTTNKMSSSNRSSSVHSKGGMSMKRSQSMSAPSVVAAGEGTTGAVGPNISSRACSKSVGNMLKKASTASMTVDSAAHGLMASTCGDDDEPGYSGDHYGGQSSTLPSRRSSMNTVITTGSQRSSQISVMSGDKFPGSGSPKVALGPGVATVVSAVDSHGGLSKLQEALVECGRLMVADEQALDPVRQRVEKSLQHQRKAVKKHAGWLRSHDATSEPAAGSSYAEDDDGRSYDDRTASTRRSHARSHAKSLVPISSSGASAASLGSRTVTVSTEYLVGSKTNDLFQPASSKDPEQWAAMTLHSKDYNDELTEYMRVKNKPRNPFRDKEHTTMNRARKEQLNVPTDYRQGRRVERAGNYAVVIRPTSLMRASEVPYKDEIKQGLAYLAKRNVICYDMRIVETASTLKVHYCLFHCCLVSRCAIQCIPVSEYKYQSHSSIKLICLFRRCKISSTRLQGWGLL